MIQYSKKHKLFYWAGSYENRHIPKGAGFKWEPNKFKKWVAGSPYVAYKLKSYASPEARKHFKEIDINIKRSAQATLTDGSLNEKNDIPVTAGNSYLPFQKAGIKALCERLKDSRGSALLADEQGLGKTIQAIGIANLLGYTNLLVICPASLRLNWVKEIEQWHVHNKGVLPILRKTSMVAGKQSVVTSYDLAENAKKVKPDLVIIDEAHYLKNPGTKRTKTILGGSKEKWPGLIHGTPALFLTGTPIPNKPAEFWPLLYRTAPEVIDGMKYWDFVRRFHNIHEDQFGVKIDAPKNHEELQIRLRGSGFMVRRLKKDVLKELPPKSYKMVVFPQVGPTKRIISKEKEFNFREIVANGVPVGSGLPELRHEMGVEKVPQCIKYIKEQLDYNIEKAVVFAYHREVIRLLAEGLRDYDPAVITGSTPATSRHKLVDSFQNEKNVRLLIGNIQAAGTGFTLTSAHDVIIAEPSWVPGENDQCIDRCHRIGQMHGVNVHYPVVEESLDALVLGAAARKQSDIRKVLE